MDRIKAAVRAIPDFPIEGILFRDIMPVLRDGDLLNQTVQYFVEHLQGKSVDYIVGIESRGFILGVPLACKLGVGFVPIRKKGKLPGPVARHEYDLEYGSDIIEVQADAVPRGSRVVVMDDLLATGGTAAATINLLNTLEADIVSVLFMIELADLAGRDKLPAGTEMHAMIRY
ncbi:MAG: adenine phosphoribosyltransferase [Candidatus Melainabacteria bacterium]